MIHDIANNSPPGSRTPAHGSCSAGSRRSPGERAAGNSFAGLGPRRYPPRTPTESRHACGRGRGLAQRQSPPVLGRDIQPARLRDRRAGPAAGGRRRQLAGATGRRPDAVAYWGFNKAYFFYGDHYVRYNIPSTEGVDAEYLPPNPPTPIAGN